MGLAKKGLGLQEDEDELLSVDALQDDLNQSDLSSVGSEFDESSDEEDAEAMNDAGLTFSIIINISL